MKEKTWEYVLLALIPVTFIIGLSYGHMKYREYKKEQHQLKMKRSLELIKKEINTEIP